MCIVFRLKITKHCKNNVNLLTNNLADSMWYSSLFVHANSNIIMVSKDRRSRPLFMEPGISSST